MAIFVRDLGERYGATQWTDDGRATIYLGHDLSEVQRRCTLAHELTHVELGPTGSEERVIRHTARWLLPDIEVIGRNLVKDDLKSAATHMDVTLRVLLDRLNAMTAAEVDDLGRILRPARGDLLRAVPDSELREGNSRGSI